MFKKKKSREHPNEIRYHRKFRKFTTPIIIIVLLIVVTTVVLKGNMYITGFYLSIFLVPLLLGGYIGSLSTKAEFEEILPYMDRSLNDFHDAKNKMRDEWEDYYRKSRHED